MNRTKIPWAEWTWNPVIGCTRVSEGCGACYAEYMAARLRVIGKSEYAAVSDGHNWTGELRCIESRLGEPVALRKPSRIFVCSMSDLFHEKVPLEFIAQVFDTMASATADCGKNHQHEEECWCGPQHTFLLLTKRAERMRRVLTDELPNYIGNMPGDCCLSMADWPLPNLWLGVTAENQRRTDERIPLLIQTPAALRFVSCEPMLEAIDLNKNLGGTRWIGGQRGCDGTMPERQANGRVVAIHHHDDRCQRGLDWLIAGAETGPRARPFDLDWARDLRDQCGVAGVPFFMKQGGKIKYEHLPADLQVRQFPSL